MRWMPPSPPTIARLLLCGADEVFGWRMLMSLIRDDAADTSWRRRPSILDIIQGNTTPLIKRPPNRTEQPS